MKKGILFIAGSLRLVSLFSCPMPTYYQCQRCTACCRWPGLVKLSDREIQDMALFFRMTEADFIEKYTKLRPDRKGLSLKDRYDGACILLKEDRCLAQSAKPQQCRDFPNLWNYEGFRNTCKSSAIEMSIPDYEQKIQKETGRSDYRYSETQIADLGLDSEESESD
jgi:uncharacterized protein